MGYPPPDQITDEIDESTTCEWSDCEQLAATTRYDDFRREWVPVCDEHRR